jgi:glucoamylase
MIQTTSKKTDVIRSRQAPGKPGEAPHWTTSQKNGVGTARGLASHVWFATHHGIVGEIYYPRIDCAAVRDLGMLVTDGKAFFSEEKTDTDSKIAWFKSGVPGCELSNQCRQDRYFIKKWILTDPRRHVLLQKTRFEALQGSIADFHLYVLLAPHLDDRGEGNSARVGEFKGTPMLMAERDGFAVALACSAPWLHRSAGFVGVSDGWQDLHSHKRITWEYEIAERGNVALTGEIDLSRGGEFVLALGFGRNVNEAGHRARASLTQGFDMARQCYEEGWSDWQHTLRELKSGPKANSTAYRVSTAVLATHESKGFQGSTIASLSIPWGEVHGDKDQAGYHLVWPRDAYEAAGALLAAGATEEVTRALNYFETTQEADGHWPQNMWLDGSQFWKNIQLDETAAPILLLDLARRNQRVNPDELKRLWQMVRNAAGYIVRNGPSTPEDRWEEDAGLTAYTLASAIAAMLVAADLANDNREPQLGIYLRETADAWNDSIERWTYAVDTPLARKVGVSGYYVRIAPPGQLSGKTPLAEATIKIPNLPDEEAHFSAAEIVSVDALALVRFGLRAADDPRIANTLRVIDAVLKVETPHGPCWHRYNHDGYGEHRDGSPFDGTGIGRAWPLFVGERAHYELAAGNSREARRLLGVMEALAGDSGLISEQVWDAAPIPDKELFPGRPTGSARPLVWAHAEHVKLLRSLADGAVFDTPPQTVRRYLVEKVRARHTPWRLDGQVEHLTAGKILRIETTRPASVRWSVDQWKSTSACDAHDSGVGLFAADLPTEALPVGANIEFAIDYHDGQTLGRNNFAVLVVRDSG